MRLISSGKGPAAVWVILTLAAPSLVVAQEPLRWKFEQGEKLDYKMVQDMSIGNMGGQQGEQSMTMRQELDMTWNIEEVTGDGAAVIHQKVDRVRMKMTLPPPLGEVQYDTDSEELPTGPAAMFAPMYSAMTKGSFVITMSPRGEITDVKVPEEVVAAIKNSPGAATMGEMATADGFKKMISQGSLVLPEEAPKEGDQWSTKVEVNNPMAGKQVVNTTYRYQDTKEIEGVEYAVFEPSIEMSFEGSPVKITEQQSSGQILFNVEEGRLGSSNLEQKITLEQPGGGQTKIDQQVEVTMSPAGEAASEASTEDSTARSTESESP